MPSFQRYLFPPEWIATGTSVGGLMLEMWRMGSFAGSASNTAQINGLVSSLGEMMAQRQNGKQETARQDTFFYVNVSVSDTDWELICTEYSDVDAVLLSLGEHLLLGFKIGFSYNHQNGLTICSLTDRRPGSVSYGACLSGSADGWYDSWRVVLFKFHVILKGNLGTEETQKDRRPRIG